MKLSQLAIEYVTFKQSLGMRFRTESVILNAFCRAMGDIDITEVSSGPVQNYLAVEKGTVLFLDILTQ